MDNRMGSMNDEGAFRRRPRRNGLVAGAVLAAFGGLLLMRQLEMLPNPVEVWDFWPLLVIGAGLGRLQRRRGPVGVLVSLLIAAVGAALLLANLGLVAFELAQYWPVLLVLAGIAMMVGGGRHGPERCASREVFSADYVKRSVRMGGAQIRVDSRQFRGGQLETSMGAIDLDLRHADIEGEEAVIEFQVFMGGVEIRVPEAWRVVNEVAPTLGAVEDKTVAPAVADATRKRLVLRGTLTLGAVSVKN